MSTKAVDFTGMVASMICVAGTLLNAQGKAWAYWLALSAALVAWVCALVGTWRSRR